MIDILIIILKWCVYLFFGILGYITATMCMNMIQLFQFGFGQKFGCLACNWMKGKKIFKPLTAEQQEWVDFATKELDFN